jgi:hypothetical protein
MTSSSRIRQKERKENVGREEFLRFFMIRPSGVGCVLPLPLLRDLIKRGASASAGRVGWIAGPVFSRLAGSPLGGLGPPPVVVPQWWGFHFVYHF